MRFLLFFGLLFSFAFAEVESLVGKRYEDLKLENNLTCPIKFVPIAQYKKWLGYVQYNDGKVIPVSSPKYTFVYFNTESPKNINGIYKLYMTDFESGKIIEANGAHYVFGSRIMSVGGDDIIPFENERDAKIFLESNAGRKIYGFERMDKNFIDYLDMR